MRRRQAVDYGVGQPGGFESGPYLVIGLERRHQLLVVILDQIDKLGILMIERLHVMPGFVTGRTFALDGVRPVIAFEVQDRLDIREMPL